MEVKFTELDNNNNSNHNFVYDSNNYWEKQEDKEIKKKKKVTFNDILSNMNLVVNKEGILQFMIPKNEPELFLNPQENLYSNKQNTYNQENAYNQENNIKNNEPIDPNVKHSYIYNKYFKNYAGNKIEKVEPRIPKTIEEYKRMLLEDKIKAIEHKKMIEQVKSKKMMFTATPYFVNNSNNIQASKNNLKLMNFK
jgi:hypothetical protein